MSPRIRLHAANGLTTLRVLLTPLYVGAVWTQGPIGGTLAGLAFTCVAASDVLDGRAARRWGSASNAGRTFDHLADVGFLLAALAAYAALGIAPWWVPAAVAGSFVFYVVDSWSRATAGRPSLIGSRLGHLAGVLNYTLVGVLTFNNAVGLQVLPAAALNLLFWSVPLYSAAAVIARLGARYATVPVDALVTGSE